MRTTNMTNKNQKHRFFPVIYATVIGILAFIAVINVCKHTFQMTVTHSLLISSLVALIFYISAYILAYISNQIKYLVAKHCLSADDLAKITGLKSDYFPIHNNKLSLIVAKRKWLAILCKLREYDEKKGGRSKID